MPEDAEEVLQEGKVDDIVQCVYCNHCSEVNDLFVLTDCIQWPKGSINAPKPFLPKQKRKANAKEAV